jgi:CheY-like chemotaxis protein
MEHPIRAAILDRRTILLIADEPTACGPLVGVLQHQGFAVVVAADPDEALREAHTLVPDLIIVEVLSPDARERMLARLRSCLATRSIPFVVTRRQRSTAHDAGHLRVPKPEVNTLLEHVWRMVNASNPGGSRSSDARRRMRASSGGG